MLPVRDAMARSFAYGRAMQLRDAFEAILRDVRQGVRMARRTPMFSAVVVTTLALAIGGNTAVASLANAILLRPLPYPASDRLGLVVTNRRAGARGDTQDAQDGAGWRALQRGVKTMDVALLAPSPSDGVNFVADGAAVAVQQVRVSTGYFRVLGVAP